MKSSAEILNIGTKCLIDNLGNIEAEEYIAAIQRERFDYTEWRKNLFDGMSLSEVNEAAAEYGAKHPFKGKAEHI